jgi:maltose-binding protein MalE
MVSPKGFSINANISEEKKKWAIELIRFLTSDENELEAATLLHTMPTRKSVLASEFVKTNDIMRNSQIQIEHGRAMPVVPELRAIWDAMRPSYQAVLGGSKSAEQAAIDMQGDALRKIKEMNE